MLEAQRRALDMKMHRSSAQNISGSLGLHQNVIRSRLGNSVQSDRLVLISPDIVISK